MNLFRSEEHIRNWAQFNPDPDIHVVMPLDKWMDRFSQERFQSRLRLDYVTWYATWRSQQVR